MLENSLNFKFSLASGAQPDPGKPGSKPSLEARVMAGHGIKKFTEKKKKEKELAEAEISRLAWPGQKRTKAWTESKVDLGHFPIIAPAKRLKIWSKWYQ